MRIGFEHTSYTLSEVIDYEEMCVTSLSPGIDEIFTISIANDTAPSKIPIIILCC